MSRMRNRFADFERFGDRFASLYESQETAQNEQATSESSVPEDYVYQLKAPAQLATIVSTMFESPGPLKQEAEPDPPRWTFFSGVFSLPFQKDALSRWIFLSINITLLGWGLAFTHSWADGFDGRFGLLMTIFSVPIVVLSVLTLAFTCACCLVIVEDTAAGGHRVTHWLEPSWREWIPRLFLVLYIASLASVVGFGMGQIADAVAGAFVPVAVITALVVFPVFLLSVLESGSLWATLSIPILRSLISLWWGWGLFYLISGGLALLWVGLILVGWPWEPFTTVCAAGPLLAAYLFISARLLGRLAWRAAE